MPFRGSEAIEGISLDMSKVKEICMHPNIFTKMHRLRFFKFYNSISGENRCKVHHVRSMESLFNELRYFHWDGYPLKSLPSKISPEHLVSLEMPNSNIEQLWNGVQCSNFKRFPEISCNIEQLDLVATAIEELPSSIGNLSRLVTLDLRKCSRLKKVSSSLCDLKSLESLYLSGCLKLEKLPEEIGNLGSLKNMVANETAISQEDDHHPPRGSIWYPGSEIPEWFSFQSMGSSVTLELPPGWFNNNFVGFALCAIVPEFRGDTRDLLVDCEFKLKTKDGDWHVATYLLSVWNEDFGVNSSLESDHVLLGYDFSMDLDGLGGSDKACIQFYIGNYLDKRIEGFDVKKCGAHLIFAQDPIKRLRSKVEDDQ
ncbi:hypothetical protein CUMW_232830, partial [Citrus unshiu]